MMRTSASECHSGARQRREAGIPKLGATSFRVRRFATPRNDARGEPASQGSEIPRRRLLDFGAAGAEVEEFLAGESEGAGEQGGRHLLDAGVVLLDCVVEEASA